MACAVRDVRARAARAVARARYREDQLHVDRVDFLVPGNADGPAKTARAQRLPDPSGQP